MELVFLNRDQVITTSVPAPHSPTFHTTSTGEHIATTDLTCLNSFTLRTDHLMKTSAHAPQHPMVSYTEMGTVGFGPHGLLRY
ncbi:hypothetical protein TNCV_1620351 [Trichonephila clavipes]|nr:hypothetical protein TNCV_1620351 [Trichonephila clavipes]